MDLAVFTGGGGGGGGALEGKSSEAGRRRAYLRQSAMMLQESFSVFEKARMPVLAAIQGGCVGGAVDMVTRVRLRYATEDAFFVIQEINIGMTADVGTLQRLPKLIPEGVAASWRTRADGCPPRVPKRSAWSTTCSPTQEDMLAGSHGDRATRSRPSRRSRSGARRR